MNPTDFCLNDLIMNPYMGMICQRTDVMSVHYIDTHEFSMFFEMGYNRQQNNNLFKFKMVLVPIHLKQREHWCLGIIWPKQKRIELYDSLFKIYSSVHTLQKLLDYVKWHGGNKVNTNLWTLHDASDRIPQQQNSIDCGVFTCVYAEYATRNQFNFDFSQEHMPYFRTKILYEICTGRLLEYRYKVVRKLFS